MRRSADGCDVGVDVGGSKISAAAVSGGDMSTPLVEGTQMGSTTALIEQIVALARRVADDRGIRALGVGVPSIVDFAAGVVRSSVNVPLTDVPLRHLLERRLGVPVIVDNDATAAAVAELHLSEQGVRSLVMITVGTGIGGGIVLDGRPYRGASGGAGEFGAMVVQAAPRVETAVADHPNPGTLEALAAGRTLDRLAREYGYADGPHAVERAQKGDRAAEDVLARIGRRLGLGLANIINVFAPDAVVIGGGVAAAGDLIVRPALAAAAPFLLPGIGTRTRVRVARAGVHAGVYGAGLLAGLEAPAGD